MSSKPQKEPMFIVASGRSGTTMLRIMFNNHSCINMPSAAYFLPQLMERLPLNSPLSEEQKRLAFDLLSNHEEWESWADAPERLWDTISSLQQPLLGQLIGAIFHNCNNPENKPRWGSKTLSLNTKMESVHQVFPNAKFIHIIRDARDVCLSLRNAYLRQPDNDSWRRKGQSISKATSHWCTNVEAIVQSGKKLGPDLYLEIRYEDLVLKTEETLKQVCAFIGEEYDSKMLSFYNTGPIKEKEIDFPKIRRPPEPSDTARWRTEMNLVEVALIEAYAGKTMDRVGQTRRFRGLLRLIPYSLIPFIIFRRIFTPTNKARKILKRLKLAESA